MTSNGSNVLLTADVSLLRPFHKLLENLAYIFEVWSGHDIYI